MSVDHADKFDREVRAVAARLRRVADDFERRCVAGTSIETLRPDRTGPAYDAVRAALVALGQVDFAAVMYAAIRADFPVVSTSRSTMLDQATTVIDEAFRQQASVDGRFVPSDAVAENVLRAIGAW